MEHSRRIEWWMTVCLRGQPIDRPSCSLELSDRIRVALRHLRDARHGERDHPVDAVQRDLGANGVNWVIVTVYVPALLVSSFLIFMSVFRLDVPASPDR